MMTWVDPVPVRVPSEVSGIVGGHPLVSEILVRRGISDPERIQAFLDPDVYTPGSPYELDGMQAAVDRLSAAIQEKQRICVWGDFDVDGQTATSLLVASLRKLVGHVQYHIPIRDEESHGINLPKLKERIASGIDLLLTCDTGIGEHESVDYANSRGVDVIITDHHDLPPELPQALAVVNPKRGATDHPMAGLPGVGVAYELARALFERLGQPGGADEHLDLVALGIVSDLAPHTSEVRYLLQRGLRALQETRRIGLQMLMENAEIDPVGATEEHIGFEIGPRLNALGRLNDAGQAVDLLTSDDKSVARPIANLLEGLNAQRKMITGQVYQGALAKIDADPTLLQYSALVLSHPEWPGGVIGIVASRLVERYNKPALLITAPAGELARGSARSIPGVDISAAIAAQQELLEGFGGHPMAAGFSLDVENIPAFREGLYRTVSEMISTAPYEPTLQIDAEIPLNQLNLELVTDLERLAPFGPGNPYLVFTSRNLIYRSSRQIGHSGDHLLVSLEDSGGQEHKVVWWGGGIEPLPDWMASGAVLKLAYTARSRNYRGKGEVQVEWLGARQIEDESREIAPARHVIEVIDHRNAPAPLMELKQLCSNEENLVIWAEAGDKHRLSDHGITTHDRYEIYPSDELAIWSIPPGRQEFNVVIKAAAPDKVHLFAVDPGMDEITAFTERLVGLAKYALKTSKGEASIAKLAAATAQREETVRAGLQWLAAGGYLAVNLEPEGWVCMGEGAGERGKEFDSTDKLLKELLEESAAFRRNFARAGADSLIEKHLE